MNYKILKTRKVNILFNKPTPTPLQGGEQWNSFSGFQYFILIVITLTLNNFHVNRVREYVKRQEKHHSKRNAQEEFEGFINKYGFTVFG